MKVFISIDREGVSGLVQWDSFDSRTEQEMITAEVNAAIAGAFEGGATEVLVTEAHGSMRNLIPERIDNRATFLSGQPKPKNHMAGVDDAFSAAMLVGHHSKAGTLNGIMSHTFAPSIFSLRFNNVEVGEIGVDAAIAGYYGVPVVLVTGDDAACEEARALLGAIETAVVKRGISRSAGVCIPPDQARKLIRAAAQRAAKLVSTPSAPKAFRIEPPIKVRVTFTDPSYADGVVTLPFAERVDGRTIAFTADDFIVAFELFNSMQFLAGVVR